MNWLLKIADGPMKGAEIALVTGTRVTLGRGDGCDIVIADASLADEALSLDVAEGGVTMVRADGSGLAMRSFEVHAIGTTALAVGPAEGTWEELRPAPAEKPEESETPVEASSADAEASPRPEEGESAGKADGAKTGGGSKKRVWGSLFVLLVLAAALVAGWWWRAPILELVASVKGERKAPAKAVATSSMAKASLEALAREHGLRFATTNGFPLLAGNLRRRTERHAIRALALAANRRCRFDLSDDESFKSAAETMLFAATEDAVRPVAAVAREIALKGYAPSEMALSKLLAAMREDIPWLKAVDAKGIQVGGAVPAALRGSRFAMTGELSSKPRFQDRAPSVPAVASGVAAATPAVTNLPVSVKGTEPFPDASGKPSPETVPNVSPELTPEERRAVELVSKAERSNGVVPKDLLPVAGILTKPYPCVVLSNGHRLIEGAKISGLEIVGIEAAKIVFAYKEKKVSWEP